MIANSAQSNDGVNILLVDDQPGKLLTYEAILSDLNANLIKVTSAQEALSTLLKTEIAVILMDVCMPDLDGFELATMIRQHPRHEKTAIIFISAVRIEAEDLIRGFQSGAVDYVSVPVVPAVLKARVQVFIELYRKTRQLDALNSDLEARVAERTIELDRSTDDLRRSEERLRLASSAARLATYEFCAENRKINWSSNAGDLLGTAVTEHETLDAFLDVVHSEDREMFSQFLFGAGDASTGEIEFRIKSPSGLIWVLARVRAFASTDTGRPRVLGTLLDITKRKLAENHQHLLMAELDHRVKNILANIAAIARLSSANAQSIGGFVSALDGRIQAMSSAHDLLRQNSWTSVELDDLVFLALKPFRPSISSEISVEGERLRLTSKFAQSMALVLHELVTNATKHGALAEAGGQLSISWKRVSGSGGDRLYFSWTEVRHRPIAAPARKGFGLTVVQTAAAECGGVADFKFLDAGFEFKFDGELVPLARSFWKGQSLNTGNGVSSGARNDVEDTEPSGCRILIVEDEPLIALQLKSMLEDEGHTVIGPIARLSEGMKVANDDTFDIALVDINLGADISAPMAEILSKRGIPFAFTTGFNDLIFLPAELRNAPRLAKPYSRVEMQDLIEKLRPGRSPSSSRDEKSDRVA